MKISRINCVAIIYNGVMYSLPKPNRHHDIIKYIHEQTGDTDIQGIEGFLTEEGVFVNRRKAKLIAIATNQTRHTQLRELYSEDVW